MSKLENLTLWEKVYRHLHDEILDNRLPPGSELQEVTLAESLGVSRGPVREAIGRLAADGLVRVRPRRGAVVTPLSKKEFVEAYQVREALEVLSIRLAIPHLEPGDLEDLQGYLSNMEASSSSGDVEGFFKENARFHATFVGRSGNEKLQTLHAQLLGQMGRYQNPSLALRGELGRSVEEHRQIIQAIERGDAPAAARLLSEHIRMPLNALNDLDEELFMLEPNGKRAPGPPEGAATGVVSPS